MSVKCQRWVLKSHFSGMPKREDLDLVEEELPPLKDGGEEMQITKLITNIESVHKIMF